MTQPAGRVLGTRSGTATRPSARLGSEFQGAGHVDIGRKAEMTMPVPDSSAVGASTQPPRKRQARGERRIDQIMAAAEELIAERGMQAVGMNAIARHAGISPGSLYQYFPGKSAILEELCRRLVGRLQHMAGRASCTSFRPAQPTPETTLDRLLEAAMLLAQEHPALLPLLTATDHREPNPLLEAISRSLPASGTLSDKDVVRDLATRIFCAGVSLAVQQADPGAVLLLTRQAVLSSLQATEDLSFSTSPPATSQAGP